ncbi:IS110 family transposase [Candidatus Poriferisocius sp.]|uniref:IS110 family transposase n=1 Tax=Candidatus Poriferisocius sp. TaxID=3101276 RepID=UPI003B5B4636
MPSRGHITSGPQTPRSLHSPTGVCWGFWEVPHEDTFTVGVVDCCGVETCCEAFSNTRAGYGGAIDLLAGHGVEQVGVEGSAKWGAHVAIALSAAGFDTREVPTSRSAAQRRSRRLDKTDAVDAIASARALLAEPTLGPVQALEVYDPLVGEIEEVLEHRRAHKRHLTNRVIRRTRGDENTRKQPLKHAARQRAI